jgi:hypothetical protein
MKELESATFFRSSQPIDPFNKFASELIAKRKAEQDEQNNKRPQQ